jgi:alginate O-acetyltransferase complex protein AlgI
MRPFRSFLLLLLLLAVLTGLHYFMPVSSLFPPLTEFIPERLVRIVFPDEDQPVRKEISPAPDTTRQQETDTLHQLLPAKDTLQGSAAKVGPLDVFLDSLNNSRGQIRVMYYGDSQIEGDRMTSNLRHCLRKGHGGTGPGLLLPLMPVMYTKTVWIRSSSNWKKYNYLSYSTGAIKHKRLGPFMAVCRYLPAGKKTATPEKASMRITPSYLADVSSASYEKLRIFYGDAEDSVTVKVSGDNRQVFSSVLQPGSGIKELNCKLGLAKDINIEFEGTSSPDIYGISIESADGVIVDNIPQRGSAGLEFTMVDSANLAEFYRILRPDLIVLQYGLNIVRNVRHEYTYFQRGLERQLALIRSVSPSTPVLVVSITDMAESDGNGIRSFPNIPAIINAQKRAAGNMGEAFWNSYMSMGGDSSIIRWAEKNPPYAQKDYVHFTYLGADTLSGRMVKDLFYAVSAVRTAPVGILHTTDTTARKPEIVSEVKAASSPPEQFFPALFSELIKYDPRKPLIFSAAPFWFFLLTVLLGYSFIYKKPVVRNGYLFLVSLFFYYKSGGLFLFLLLIVTSIDFTCGLLIYNSARRPVRKLLILISIISNIGLLAYFKYTGFFVTTMNDLLGTSFEYRDFLADFSNSLLGTSFNISYIMLPVGISFFTFQSLSYTIDVYRGKMTPVRNLVDFGFYVSFFPQLVAGPIVRASEFIPQIYNDFQLSKREFSHAMFLISKGLIKKILISDFIAVTFIDRVFDAPSLYSGFENLMAIYGYGLQIYCDFSGYTDIAIGLGLILGFRLPINFNSPYKATDISDFWKRWHISLSRWLKDYLYIPLGGNRKGKIREYINVMLTMIIGGLWHGAALRFIIWGGLHGAGLVVTKIWHRLFGEKLKLILPGRALAVFITLNFVSFCWIFFRTPDLQSAGIMLHQVFTSFSPGTYMTVLPAYGSAFLLILVGYVIHMLPESVKESYRGLFINIPLAAQLVVILAVGVLLFRMRSTDIMPFIYFRF